MRKHPRLRASSSARRSRAVPAPEPLAVSVTTTSLHACLRAVIAEPLVVLHVDHSHHAPVHLGDQRHVADLPEVPGEGLPVGGVAGGARRHAPAQLDQQRGHRRPIAGRRETDDDLGHQDTNGHPQGEAWQRGHPSA